ncbi:hypothetical protein [Paenibacillus sp. JZ16]|uniref:hypothetical protein n=1 Tax=Paenibacillus sp. JZ16 TaxID=1906272 RepID=UPI00188A9574|nr:hypothetical protein [Paenibacillus sp. JZ16]
MQELEGLLQLVGALTFILSIYTMFIIIGHINRSKKNDAEVLKILKEIKDNNTVNRKSQ